MRWKPALAALTMSALALTMTGCTVPEDAPEEPLASIEAQEPAASVEVEEPAAGVEVDEGRDATLITGTGMGPAQIGMTLDSVMAIDELGIVPDDATEWCQTVFGDLGGGAFAAAATPDGSGVVYGMWLLGGDGQTPDAPTTSAGAGLGTGSDELEELHPGGQWVSPDRDYESWEINAKYVVDVDGGPVAFGVIDEHVAGVAVGANDFPNEFCG